MADAFLDIAVGERVRLDRWSISGECDALAVLGGRAVKGKVIDRDSLTGAGSRDDRSQERTGYDMARKSAVRLHRVREGKLEILGAGAGRNVVISDGHRRTDYRSGAVAVKGPNAVHAE